MKRTTIPCDRCDERMRDIYRKCPQCGEDIAMRIDERTENAFYERVQTERYYFIRVIIVIGLFIVPALLILLFLLLPEWRSLSFSPPCHKYAFRKVAFLWVSSIEIVICLFGLLVVWLNRARIKKHFIYLFVPLWVILAIAILVMIYVGLL